MITGLPRPEPKLVEVTIELESLEMSSSKNKESARRARSLKQQVRLESKEQQLATAHFAPEANSTRQLAERSPVNNEIRLFEIIIIQRPLDQWEGQVVLVAMEHSPATLLWCFYIIISLGSCKSRPSHSSDGSE